MMIAAENETLVNLMGDGILIGLGNLGSRRGMKMWNLNLVRQRREKGRFGKIFGGSPLSGHV